MGNSYRKQKAALRKKREDYYYRLQFGSGRWRDDSYALPEDEPLTQEEKEAVQAFWGKYSFAYPDIDFRSFQTFKNRTGKFDPRHLPGGIKKAALNYVDSFYTAPFQNKAMLEMLYTGIPQPETIVRRMNCLYYDGKYNHITLTRTINIMLLALKKGDLFFKLNFTSGGSGVFLLEKGSQTKESLREMITKTYANYAFVVQKPLKQNDFMRALNPSSVNTVRITTMLFKQKVYCLAALIRIGSPGSNVDNWCSGGSLLGVDMETGICNGWAMGNDMRRYTQLPSGVDLQAAQLVVPNFEAIKAAVTRQHYRIPYVRFISWDIALDENDTPTMIECNFAGMHQIHEAVNGPLLGDLTEQVCDEYLLKRFYLRFAQKHFICREYHDHVEIEKYLGSKKADKVVIPQTLQGKPVTKVDPDALRSKPGGNGMKSAIKRIPWLYSLLKRVRRCLDVRGKSSPS